MERFIIIVLIVSLVLGFDMKVKLPDGFSYINEIDPTILIQIRYATPLNFIGQIVDGYLKSTGIISTKAAFALKSVQQTLRQYGYSLIVYDSYRPQRGVDHMVRWTEKPEDYKTKQQFYPFLDKSDFIPNYLARKSGHSRGSTVDLSIIALNQQIHDVKLQEYTLKDGRKILIRDDGTQFMCGHFDLIDQSSHHDTDLIKPECSQKRNLLRDIMKKNGFRFLQQQWWHYTLQNEPFPNTYFDFVIE